MSHKAEDFVLAPREPTREMMEAWHRGYEKRDINLAVPRGIMRRRCLTSWSRRQYVCASVAQGLEQPPVKRWVAGSNPARILESVNMAGSAGR